MSLVLIKKTPSRIRNIKKRLISWQQKQDNENVEPILSAEYDEILAYISVWKCSAFLAPTYYQQLKFNILVQISHIGFPQLTLIGLNECQIANIEALAFINCPNLSSLQIEQNIILSLKPLAKCNFPKLSKVWMASNMFNHSQLGYMTRTKTSQQTTRIQLSRMKLWFLGLNYQTKSPKIEMVNQLIKHQSVFLDRITFSYGNPRSQVQMLEIQSNSLLTIRIREVFNRKSYDEQRKRIAHRFSVQGTEVISC